ncbi:MAG TPA: hypothetical protein VFH10_18125 [Nocardioides sp.]|uniref:hypothetical protein n=1 Tax=Nocardioides sp. TaxID=35761 RepID=UPI002D80E09B|nr:hypothetical protein [Nocardioides sp.]HET6654561.1 hypothetical protein [Nocardioides sp.]
MRRLFSRAPDVPADVVARAGLPRGTKVLAAAGDRAGTWLLGTRDHLVVVPGSPVVEPGSPVVEPGSPVVEPGSPVVEPVETRHIPWEQVESAEWRRDDDRLRVSEVGEYGRPRPVHEYVIDDPGQLLAFVRERVTASVVLQRRVVVRERRGLTVVARRAPGGTGDLTWAYELDEGLDPDDPVVREMAERGVRTAAEELGLA